MPRGSYAAASVTRHRSTRVLTVQACKDNAPSIAPGQEADDLGRAIRRYSQNEVSAFRIFKQIKFCRHLCPASAVMAKCPAFILTANPIKCCEVQEPSNISHAALVTLPTQHRCLWSYTTLGGPVRFQAVAVGAELQSLDGPGLLVISLAHYCFQRK